MTPDTSDFDDLLAVLEADNTEYVVLYEMDGHYPDLDGVELEGEDHWYDFDGDGNLIGEFEAEDECEYAE